MGIKGRGNNFSEVKAIQLIDLANSSIYNGRAQDARSLMIKTNIKILELLCQEKEEIENNQDDDFASSIKNLKTIPAVADKTITAIITEYWDLKRFDWVKSFIGYLGLYPTQYQSSNSLNIGRLAKRGISIAKHVLYRSTVSSVLHNNELHKIFRDKVLVGKSKKKINYNC